MRISAVRTRAGLRESLVDMISEAEAEAREHEVVPAELQQLILDRRALLEAFDATHEAEILACRS
jgi:hypothetical protein